MQIVIDIPNEMYDWLDNGFPDEDDAKKLWQIVKNGTLLPKGHGDLKDVNDLKRAFISWSMVTQGKFTDADIASIVCNSPIIINADRRAE